MFGCDRFLGQTSCDFPYDPSTVRVSPEPRAGAVLVCWRWHLPPLYTGTAAAWPDGRASCIAGEDCQLARCDASTQLPAAPASAGCADMDWRVPALCRNGVCSVFPRRERPFLCELETSFSCKPVGRLVETEI